MVPEGNEKATLVLEIRKELLPSSVERQANYSKSEYTVLQYVDCKRSLDAIYKKPGCERLWQITKDKKCSLRKATSKTFSI